MHLLIAHDSIILWMEQWVVKRSSQMDNNCQCAGIQTIFFYRDHVELVV